MTKSSKDIVATRGRMRGFLASLTEEKRTELRAYRGPDGVKPMDAVPSPKKPEVFPKVVPPTHQRDR